MLIKISDIKQFYYSKHDYESGLRIHNLYLDKQLEEMTYRQLFELVDAAAVIDYFCSILTVELLYAFLKVWFCNILQLFKMQPHERVVSLCFEFTEIGVSDSLKAQLKRNTEEMPFVKTVKDNCVRTLLQCLLIACNIVMFKDINSAIPKFKAIINVMDTAIIPYMTECRSVVYPGQRILEPPYVYTAFCIAEFMHNQ